MKTAIVQLKGVSPYSQSKHYQTEKLPKELAKDYEALSMFGILSELTTSASQKRLEAKVEIVGTRIPSARAAMDALGAAI